MEGSTTESFDRFVCIILQDLHQIPGVELLMSPLMQCANKNTREKGHNFEPRNPRVPAFRVLFRWHIPAKRVVILNLKIPAFRVLIQKCIPAIRVHFILKSCDIIVELLGHLSVL